MLLRGHLKEIAPQASPSVTTPHGPQAPCRAQPRDKRLFARCCGAASCNDIYLSMVRETMLYIAKQTKQKGVAM